MRLPLLSLCALFGFFIFGLTDLPASHSPVEILPGALAVDSGGTSGYPFNTFWHDTRHESIYTVADLNAAGLSAGSEITHVELKPTSMPGHNMSNVRLRMGHFAGVNHSGTYRTASELTEVFHAPTLNRSLIVLNDWMVFPLTTTFIWNGVDSLVLDWTNDDTTYNSGGGCLLRNPGDGPRSLAGYSDSSHAFPFDGMSGLGLLPTVMAIRLAFFTGAVRIDSTPPAQVEAWEWMVYKPTIVSFYGPPSIAMTSGPQWLSWTGQAIEGRPPMAAAGQQFQITLEASVQTPEGPATATQQWTLSVEFNRADVNRDSALNVVDVQLCVNLILATVSPTYTGQGDTNRDSLVNVVDVQTIVNRILAQPAN